MPVLRGCCWPWCREFECGDVTESIDPGYDLVIARELMQHLPLASGRQFLSAVKASNATYLLATSYPDWGQANVNIEPGEVGSEVAGAGWWQFHGGLVLMAAVCCGAPAAVCCGAPAAVILLNMWCPSQPSLA